jgi:Nif-specific regulatory protein
MTGNEKYLCSRGACDVELLFEISTTLTETPDFSAALKIILEILAKYLHILRGTITIFNRANGEIDTEEAYGLDGPEMARGHYRLGEGITGRVISSGEPIAVPRISEEPLFLNKTGARKNEDTHNISFICVPIRSATNVIGAISIDLNFNPGVSLSDQVRLLTIVASTISLAVSIRQSAREELEKLKEENQRLQTELHSQYKPNTIIGNSDIMQHLYRQIEQVSSTNATVLLLGESGVGKEKIAHAIHYSSMRADKPFIKINCAAIPETLIESELFGHEKGAFTNAISQRKGRFEMADNGTIFLDEIGEMPPAIQTKFLRVLQEREFERIGSSKTIHVNVRIIAATNQDLNALMLKGRFREDLFYRLNVFPILIPPLRDRKSDIVLLSNHFMEKYSKEHNKNIKEISPVAMDLMMLYNWPGNVRELENCIERAIILSTDGIIHSYHLPPGLQGAPDSEALPLMPSKKVSLSDLLDSMERALIAKELKQTNGNIARAAKNLGISERIMGLRVAKYKLNFKKEKNYAYE